MSGVTVFERQIFSMKLASFHLSGACSSETASRYLENLWILDLSDLSSLNGFSIIDIFSPRTVI